VHQQFGFHNSPSIGDDGLASFFNSTASLTNRDAWLQELEDKPGWFTGDNSPVVLIFGASEADADTKNNSAKLKGGTYLTQAPRALGVVDVLVDRPRRRLLRRRLEERRGDMSRLPVALVAAFLIGFSGARGHR